MLTLLPLAQCELLKAKPTFITHALAAEPPHVGERVTGADLVETVTAGGYPEALTRRSGSRRSQWYANYVDTIVQRDLADVATVSDLAMLPRLLQALGEHAAQLVNYTEIGGQLGISHVTTHKYLTALELVFLVRSVAPYFSNPLKRLVKTPKVHFFDSGLLAALLAVDAGDVRADRKLFGSLLESFVFGEISKLLSRESRRPRIFHYRDREKNEIDFVVEDARKRITCIEVKASATVSPSDFAMMKKVAAAAPAKFNAGYVLYDGDRVLPFGERLWAAPISCLWG